MTTLKRILTGVLVLLGLALFAHRVYAQDEGTFVYVDDNNYSPPANHVSAFRVLTVPNGALAPIPGSPFPTGGTGVGAATISPHRIAAATIHRNFLYVANQGSNDISAFRIDTETGALTALFDSPYATGGDDTFAMSLAATANGKFLYAANFNSGDISEFKIRHDGGLTPVTGSISTSLFSLGDFPYGTKASPNSRFLGVALENTNRVAMLSIGPTGTLTFAPGSPVDAGSPGSASDVDISCKSDLLFDTKAGGGGTTVAVFKIDAATGALTPITGSPFNFPTSGVDSETGLLTPDNHHLFAADPGSGTITSLDVAPAGTLTLETDAPSGPSPFADPGAGLFPFPTGMGTNGDGTLLYAANSFGNSVSGFQIDRDGGLSAVVGSPFSTGSPASFPFGLNVFPAHKGEGEGDGIDDRGHKDHIDFDADRKCATTRGDMDFEDHSGTKMEGGVDSYSVVGNTATMTGTGALADGTPVRYTAVVTGNQPVIGANLFAISWVTSTGSIFQTKVALTNGYFAVH
jgi:6-phosphogluconolactonase